MFARACFVRRLLVRRSRLFLFFSFALLLFSFSLLRSRLDRVSVIATPVAFLSCPPATSVVVLPLPCGYAAFLSGDRCVCW